MVGTTAANYLYNTLTLDKFSIGHTNSVIIPSANSIDVVFTATDDQTTTSTFSLEFKRQTTAELANLIKDGGHVVICLIIGVAIFLFSALVLSSGVKYFHKTNDSYV